MPDSSYEAPLEDDFPFDIISHLIPVVPFREYPRAIIDENQGVRLSVKQYVPRAATSVSSDRRVTIVAAGALGFIKELYEPLFADILHQTQQSGVNIRSIWIADMFNVGESAVANQSNLGCDPAWIDHSRDLWSVMNHFITEMVKPIIGLGHSMGCNQLLCISSWHPSLFHSLAFVEPGIDEYYGRGITIPWALRTLREKSSWPTREEAESALVESHNGWAWDPRVVRRLKHYSTHQTTGADDSAWALTTSKHQIAALVSRFNPGMIGYGPDGIRAVALEQREEIPDSDADSFHLGPFYRRELKLAWDMLPSTRPWVLYVNAGKSPFFGNPETRVERARLTGTGVGGNGGLELGAVKQVVIEEGEHTMVFDHDLHRVAVHVGDWLKTESQRWTDGPRRRKEMWLKKSLEEKQTVGQDHEAALVAEMRSSKTKGKL